MGQNIQLSIFFYVRFLSKSVIHMRVENSIVLISFEANEPNILAWYFHQTRLGGKIV